MKRALFIATLFLPSLLSAEDSVSRTVSQQVFTTVTTTGASVVVRNVGQSAHWLKVCFTNLATTFTIQLEGSEDGVNYVPISPAAPNNFLTGCGMIEGGGYHNYVRANITALGGLVGTISAWYTGSSSPISISSMFTPGSATDTASNASLVKAGGAASFGQSGGYLGVYPFVYNPSSSVWVRLQSILGTPPSTLGTAQNRVPIFTNVSATSTQTGPAFLTSGTTPNFGAVGTFTLISSSITGSPSGCTLSVSGVTLDGFATSVAGASIAITLDNSPHLYLSSPSSAQGLTAERISVVFACSVYPSGGQIYVTFDPATPVSGMVSAASETAATSNGAVQVENGPRWTIKSNPSAGSQATASKAAGGSGVVHVADCIAFSAASTTAPALTALTVAVIDGATGGTQKFTWQVVIPAATGQNVAPFGLCGLNIQGTANTAMTVEFSASLANLIESVSLSGYDVN